MKQDILKQTILDLIELISTTTNPKDLKSLEAITYYFKDLIENKNSGLNPEIGFELWIYAGLQSKENIKMANHYKRELIKML